MSKPCNTISPVPKADRIPSLDFLRGLAILGILFINIENFAYPDSWSPWKYGFESDIDRDTRFWVYFLTQGKFYTMFALLFGVGFNIFLERLEKKGLGLKAMDIFSRRLLWLFIFGVIHAYFIWDGDVLYHYAICGFLLFPFRSMSNRSLVLAAGILASLVLTNSYYSTAKRIASFEKYEQSLSIPDEKWTIEQIKRNRYWKNKLFPQAEESSSIRAPKGTYWEGLKEAYSKEKVHKGLFYHSSLLLPSMLIMIIGIMLYRSGIFQDCRTWKYYWPLTLTALFSGLLTNYFRYHAWTYAYDEPLLSHWQAALFTFPKELLGIAYILLLNGLFQKYQLESRIKLISSIGRLALTNYILQSLLLGIFFYGYGFAQFNMYSRFELMGIILVFWTFQFIFTYFWLRIFDQGPFEWLWRKLTYNSFQLPS